MFRRFRHIDLQFRCCTDAAKWTRWPYFAQKCVFFTFLSRISPWAHMRDSCLNIVPSKISLEVVKTVIKKLSLMWAVDQKWENRYIIWPISEHNSLSLERFREVWGYWEHYGCYMELRIYGYICSCKQLKIH